MNILKLIRTVQRLADGQSPANVETRLDLEQVLSILVELSGGPKAASVIPTSASPTKAIKEAVDVATAGPPRLILNMDDTPEELWEGRRDLAIQRQLEKIEFE